MSTTTPAGLPAVLRLGTRASELATTQSGHVADALRARLGVEVELVHVSTEGDTSRAPLASLGGTGVFVSALREALLRGECDLAVHSLKDLPTQPYPGITLAAVPEREDPHDVLVASDGRRLEDLGPGSRIGTGSPRRAAQLAALGRGLELVGIRGNVGTRIGFVSSGELDAVVLARAGLNRLGRLDRATDVIGFDVMLPAPGQGALGVECRTDDTDLVAALSGALEHPPTRTAVVAERAVLSVLEAGCSAPLGALAEVVDTDAGQRLRLRAVAASVDGTTQVHRSSEGDPQHPYDLGAALAGEMLAGGAADLMDTPLDGNQIAQLDTAKDQA